MQTKSIDERIQEEAAKLGIKRPRIVSDVTVPIPHDLEPSKKQAGKYRAPLVRKAPKVHGNEPCTCGSSRKAKKCCYKPYTK